MIRNHDQWSKLGEVNLGENNIRWAQHMEDMEINGLVVGSGPMTLMKSIINDYWTDCSKNNVWDANHVNMVMSKIYWCWVAWLDLTHMEVDNNEE